jgi:hypothetical protein
MQSIAFRTDNIFGYFKSLDAQNKLPNFDDVEVIAGKLYRCYSTTRGLYRALHADQGPNEWADFVPMGSPWSPPPVNQTSLSRTTTTG